MKETGKMLINKSRKYALNRTNAKVFNIKQAMVSGWKSDKSRKRAVQVLQRDTL